jgi:hypothetical protein
MLWAHLLLFLRPVDLSCIWQVFVRAHCIRILLLCRKLSSTVGLALNPFIIRLERSQSKMLGKQVVVLGLQLSILLLRRLVLAAVEDLDVDRRHSVVVASLIIIPLCWLIEGSIVLALAHEVHVIRSHFARQLVLLVKRLALGRDRIISNLAAWLQLHNRLSLILALWLLQVFEEAL